jgi:hypothetical protein
MEGLYNSFLQKGRRKAAFIFAATFCHLGGGSRIASRPQKSRPLRGRLLVSPSD